MTGRKPEITDEKILEVFDRSPDPVLGAPEIAEEFGYTSSGIYKRLKDLQKQGYLDSKRVGQGRAWWLTDEGEKMLEDT